MHENIPEWGDRDRLQRNEALEANLKAEYKIKGKEGIWPFLYRDHDRKIRLLEDYYKNIISFHCSTEQGKVNMRRDKYEILEETRARYEEFTGRTIDLCDLGKHLEGSE